jgi:hypothetical protein
LNPRMMLRMARRARKPASMTQVKFFFGILLVCLTLFAVERWVGWPEFLTVETGKTKSK